MGTAIVEENGVTSFVNDLQVDLAACCTKDTEACLNDVGPAYGLLADVAAGKKGGEAGPHAAAIIIKAINNRIKADRAKKKPGRFLTKCLGEPETCTMSALKAKEQEI